MNDIGRTKDVLDVIKSLIAIIAVFGTLWWFFHQGESKPKINIRHEFIAKKIHKNWVWVYASAKLTNPGKTPVNISHAKSWLQKVLPLDDKIKGRIEDNVPIVSQEGHVEWPLIGEEDNTDMRREIPPGGEETINFEFMVPSYVTVVRFYTAIPFGGSNPPDAWSLATIHDIK